MAAVSCPESDKVEALCGFLNIPEFDQPDFDITKYTANTLLEFVRDSWYAAPYRRTPYKTLKIIVFGHGSVGKTSLVHRFVRNSFIDGYDPLCEDSYHKARIIDGQKVVLDILDTARAESWAGCYDSGIRQADGFIIVYGIDSHMFFDEKPDDGEPLSCVDDFVHDIRKSCRQKHPLIVLCGNKCDLEDDRKVQTEEGIKKADEIGCLFFETSAKTGKNVDEAFAALIRLCLAPNDNSPAVNPDGKKCILM